MTCGHPLGHPVLCYSLSTLGGRRPVRSDDSVRIRNACNSFKLLALLDELLALAVQPPDQINGLEEKRGGGEAVWGSCPGGDKCVFMGRHDKKPAGSRLQPRGRSHLGFLDGPRGDRFARKPGPSHLPRQPGGLQPASRSGPCGGPSREAFTVHPKLGLCGDRDHVSSR